MNMNNNQTNPQSQIGSQSQVNQNSQSYQAIEWQSNQDQSEQQSVQQSVIASQLQGPLHQYNSQPVQQLLDATHGTNYPIPSLLILEREGLLDFTRDTEPMLLQSPFLRNYCCDDDVATYLPRFFRNHNQSELEGNPTLLKVKIYCRKDDEHKTVFIRVPLHSTLQYIFPKPVNEGFSHELRFGNVERILADFNRLKGGDIRDNEVWVILLPPVLGQPLQAPDNQMIDNADPNEEQKQE